MPGAPGKFTAKKLAETFAAISNGGRMLEEMDVNYGRSTGADRQIQDVLACSREIYNGEKTHTPYSQNLVSSPRAFHLLNQVLMSRCLLPSYSGASSEERNGPPCLCSFLIIQRLILAECCHHSSKCFQQWTLTVSTLHSISHFSPSRSHVINYMRWSTFHYKTGFVLGEFAHL